MARLFEMSVVKPRALITGLKGFTGRYLARELTSAGYQVFGTVQGEPPLDEGVYSLDLNDRLGLKELVDEVRPDVVAHLAAISFVAHGDAEAIYRVNVLGTRNLLESLDNSTYRPRAVLLASSANIYGNTNTEVISEAEPALPANDYGVSKLAMEHMARLWMDKLPIVITRPFNYTGVGQPENFLLAKIIRHFQQRSAYIELGNLDVARDFSDVRTVAKAYARLLQLSPAGHTFNICSGKAYTLREIIAMVEKLAGYQINVRVNPAFVRANEVYKLMGDPGKLPQFIGELPEIPLIDTLAWMLASDDSRGNA
jgi:nucleoside-diphosphate-sugar epimerase